MRNSSEKALEGGIVMGSKTRIDWTDATWNPVTGCLHGCEYCYARRIAERFGGCWRLDLPPDTSWRGNVGEIGLMGDYARHGDRKCHVLDEPEIECAVFDPPSGYRGKVKQYPYYFSPTFHRYKLDEPQKWKKPRTIFVCSMADLFGDWVPDEWIAEVFQACDAAPQHRYLFLTKNPDRYLELSRLMPKHRRPPNVAELWFGRTFTGAGHDYVHVRLPLRKTFVSIEPLLRRLSYKEAVQIAGTTNWVIVGAETGHRKGKIIPEKSWIDDIAAACEDMSTPIFMKESLRELMGPDFRQEFPWEV